MDSALLSFFVVSVVIICITPGPDMIYILAHALSQGPVAGVVASVGMASGMLVHTVAVTLGLTTLMATVPLLFDVIRYVGAGYLAYIGVRSWLDSSRPAAPNGCAKVPLRTVFWRAAVTNLLNPKIILFYLAFLPQFVVADRGSTTLQLLLLGLIFVLLGLLVDAGIALVAGRVGSWLVRRGRFDRVLNRVAGTVFVLLAARLVVS